MKVLRKCTWFNPSACESASPVRGSACARQVGSIALRWFKCAWIRRMTYLEGHESFPVITKVFLRELRVLRLSETSSLIHLFDLIAALECSLDDCIEHQLDLRCGANELNSLDVVLYTSKQNIIIQWPWWLFNWDPSPVASNKQCDLICTAGWQQ